jgi:hypothetical protein
VEILKTDRVFAEELKVGDTIIIPICQQPEVFGAPSARLETITSITEVGDYGGLEFTTKWRYEYFSGESTRCYNRKSLVAKL